MARTLYRLLLTNAAITVAAFVALVFASGGWQAVAAGIALMAGFGFLAVYIALAVTAEAQTPENLGSGREPRLTGLPTQTADASQPEAPEQPAVAEPGRTPRPLTPAAGM